MKLCGFQRTVGLTAVIADGLFRAGCHAAGVLTDGDALGNAEAVALRRRDRGDKPEAGFSRYGEAAGIVPCRDRRPG